MGPTSPAGAAHGLRGPEVQNREVEPDWLPGFSGWLSDFLLGFGLGPGRGHKLFNLGNLGRRQPR